VLLISALQEQQQGLLRALRIHPLAAVPCVLLVNALQEQQQGLLRQLQAYPALSCALPQQLLSVLQEQRQRLLRLPQGDPCLPCLLLLEKVLQDQRHLLWKHSALP
jgi:hypothetical protein